LAKSALQITPQAQIHLLPQASRGVLSQIEQNRKHGANEDETQWLFGIGQQVLSVWPTNLPSLSKYCLLFKREHPNIRFNLEIGNTQSVIQQITDWKARGWFY